MNPLDDTATYRKIAEEAYKRNGPPKVTIEREKTAGTDAPAALPASSPASAASGPGFTKSFTPAERAAQDKQKRELLKKRGDL
jgi:hypothetical protein